MYDISLNENDLSFKELEQRIYKSACNKACKALSEILESLDERLLREGIVMYIEIKDLNKLA